MSTSVRLAVVALAAALAVVPTRPAPAGEEQEEKGDALNEAWIERDLAVAKRLTEVARPSPWTRKELLARLGDPSIDEEKGLDHGGMRLELRLSGGYGSAWIYAVLHDDRLTDLDVAFRPSRDVFERLAPRYGKALGEAFTKREHHFDLVWRDAPGRARFRKAVHEALGAPPEVRGGAIPAALEAHVETLTDPLRRHDVGTICYYAGVPPEGRAAIDALVAAKRFDLVRRVLHDVHPEGRVYAALALVAHAKAGGQLTAADRKAIGAVRASKLPISTCSGCRVSTEPAGGIVPPLD